MNLVDHTDPLLRTELEPFDFANPPFDPIEFAHKIVHFMYESGGIGLAANQIGVPYRVFAMRGDPENFVCFNPKIVMPSEEHVVLEEGCLSFKNLYIAKKRPKHVRVRFQTPNGETMTRTFTGMTARIFQHELDHLDGKTFIHDESRLKITNAVKKARKQGSVYSVGDLVLLSRA